MRQAVAVALAAFAAAVCAVQAELGFSRSVTAGLMRHYAATIDPGAPRRLRGWQEFVQRVPLRPVADRGVAGEAALLAPVNQFFNAVAAVADRVLWHVEDYWATPAEMLSADGADCEDYAIAKYFTLKELGVPVTKLRLVYARTWQAPNEAHMVLAYYESPDADPLILDNLQGGIERAAQRPDLTPVYTFNDDDVQILRGGAPALQARPAANRKWQLLIEKLQLELTR